MNKRFLEKLPNKSIIMSSPTSKFQCVPKPNSGFKSLIRISSIIAVLALFSIFLAGCGSEKAGDSESSESSGTSSSKGTIAISVLTTTNPFFNVIADSVKETAEAAGYDVIVTSGEFDVAKQRNQVLDFIVQKVSAIILCPCDSKAIGSAIVSANEAGIPVFTADIACLAEEAEVVSHIATDNLGGGKKAAEAMIEALGESGGKVAILDFKSAESCLLRVDGFKEVISQHNESASEEQKIQIVAELPGEGQRNLGFKTASDALQAHPDLAGIFAINDPSALGAYAALEKADKTDQVKIIAFDGQPEGKVAIYRGQIYADPIQFPDRIGSETVETILKYFAGEEVPEEILIPTELYKQEDAKEDPEVQEWLENANANANTNAEE